MLSKYLTKAMLVSVVKYHKESTDKDKILHITSPMGSGKTTAVAEFINEIPTGTKILYHSPYIVSNNEAESKLKAMGYNTSSIKYDYATNAMKRVFNKLVLKNAARDVLFESEQELVNTILEVFTESLSQYSYIFLDETDFLTVQSSSETASAGNLIPNCNRKDMVKISINTNELLGLFLLAIKYSTATCISISANQINLPKETMNLLSTLGENKVGTTVGMNGVVHSEWDVTSTINIRSIDILHVVADSDEKKERTRVSKLIAKITYNWIQEATIDTYSMYFSSKPFNGSQVTVSRSLEKRGAIVLTRTNNQEKRYTADNKLRDNWSDEFRTSNIRFIGTDNSLLDDEVFQDSENNLVAIGVSSSRAVSLVKDDKPARILIVTDTLTTSVTQAMARFRKATIDVTILLTGSKHYKEAEDIAKHIKSLDEYLLEPLNLEISYSNNLDEISARYIGRGTSKGERKGKSISAENIVREKFLSEWFANSYDAKISTRANYIIYCEFVELSNVKGVGKTTFIKRYKLL